MSARLLKIAADNLAAVLVSYEHRHGVRLSHQAIAEKAKVGKGTVQRIAKAKQFPTVDRFEAVAKVFSLQAWQLLVPGLDPTQPPELFTPELRRELDVLREFKRLVDEASERGTVGRSTASDPGSGGPSNREGIGK